MPDNTQGFDDGQVIDNFAILVADDESVIRNELAERFKAKNLKVYRASSGNQAVKRVQQYSIGIVVLDIKMKDDGIDAAARIQANNPHVRIIFLTGFDNPTFHKRAMASNVRVERWIDKGPGSVDKAVSCVVEILTRSRFLPVRQVVLQWARQEQIDDEKVAGLISTLEPVVAPLPRLAPIEPPEKMTANQATATAPNTTPIFGGSVVSSQERF